jgi:hypothetical protein
MPLTTMNDTSVVIINNPWEDDQDKTCVEISREGNKSGASVFRILTQTLHKGAVTAR